MLTMQELRSYSQKELLAELDKARKERVKVRISLKTKHEKDTSKAQKSKVYIARILTALKELDAKPATVKTEAKNEKAVEAPKKTAKKAKTK